MFTIKIIVVLLISIASSPSQLELPKQKSNQILFSKVPTKSSYIYYSICYYLKHHRSFQENQIARVIQLLLLISGSLELNPGPSVRYPCGECNKSVLFGKAIACDTCNKWFHVPCISMNSTNFNCYQNNKDLEWICCSCGLANYSTTIFNSSESSSSSSTSSITPISKKTKAKSLRIMVVNFQGIKTKKDHLEQVLIENDIDIVLGCETHLCPSIKNSEFIPENYTCFRKDRQDGWGGVIIITKSHLITEQIMSSKKAVLISIKIETLNQPVV